MQRTGNRNLRLILAAVILLIGIVLAWVLGAWLIALVGFLVASFVVFQGNKHEEDEQK